MTTQKIANVDSPVYTPELNQRMVYTNAELALAKNAVELYDGAITVDRQFRRIVQLVYGRLDDVYYELHRTPGYNVYEPPPLIPGEPGYIMTREIDSIVISKDSEGNVNIEDSKGNIIVQDSESIAIEIGSEGELIIMANDAKGIILWRNVMRERPVLFEAYLKVFGEAYEEELDGSRHIIYVNNDGNIYLSRRG